MKITIFLLLLYGTLSFADTLTLKDGSRHDGMLESSTDQYVVFNEAGMPHRYARTNVQSVEFNNAGMPNTAIRPTTTAPIITANTTTVRTTTPNTTMGNMPITMGLP